MATIDEINQRLDTLILKKLPEVLEVKPESYPDPAPWRYRRYAYDYACSRPWRQSVSEPFKHNAPPNLLQDALEAVEMAIEDPDFARELKKYSDDLNAATTRQQ